MKKGLLIVFGVVLVFMLAVPAALALTDNQKTELEALYGQLHELNLQILDKQVEAGLIDAERAEFLRDKLEQRWQYRQERMAEGEYGFSLGRRIRGGWGGGCESCRANKPEL